MNDLFDFLLGLGRWGGALEVRSDDDLRMVLVAMA